MTAKSWLIFDRRAQSVVASKDPSTPRPIASLAKLMTALVVVDRLDLSSEVKIPEKVDTLGADASRMDARPGERWKADDLLRATLIYSANDAALALALQVSDTESQFVELMNERAKEMGLADTTFGSATGLDLSGKVSTSTPQDITQLASEALQHDEIASVVAKPSLTLKRGDGVALEPMANRNPLLNSYKGVDGVKTGFTLAAGYMLVIHHIDADTGGDLIVTTFASDSEQARVRDATALLDWARPLQQKVRILEAGTPLGSVAVHGSNHRAKIFVCDDLFAQVRVAQRPVQEIQMPRSIHPPIAKGDEVGTISVITTPQEKAEPGLIDMDRLEVPICSGTNVSKLSRWETLALQVKDIDGAWRVGTRELQGTWRKIVGGS